MSDNLPFEIQMEIMKRLPVKSLLQFRSVSRSWRSVIDSSHFIADHRGQVQHLLIKYDNEVGVDIKRNYVFIVDDDSFPQQRVSPTLPPLVMKLNYPRLIGSHHGLLCLNGAYSDGPLPGKEVAVLWNISVRKAVAVVLPNEEEGGYATKLGFGVCGHEICDPKIVKIRHIGWDRDMESIPDSIPSQVEIFTLSTGAWRPLYNTNLPRTSIRFRYSQVEIDGNLYWIVADSITMDDGLRCLNLIISFDITCEEFREINLPDALAHHHPHWELSMSKLRESLVLFEYDSLSDNSVCDVWMMVMEDGSFTKLFTIYTPNASMLRVHELMRSGEPIIEILERPYDPLDYSSLVVYEPDSKQISSLGISGLSSAFSVHHYMESLVLLDHPGFIIYDKGKRYNFKAEN